MTSLCDLFLKPTERVDVACLVQGFIISSPMMEEVASTPAEQEDESFRILPLQQRSIITRLDVGPFASAYLGLLILDSTTNASSSSILTTVAFAVVLLFHVSLVLASQWNVTVQMDVGYCLVAEERKDCRPLTHCFVEIRQSPSIGTKNVSRIAGIVPIVHQPLERPTVTSENSPNMQIIFQDRVFRSSALNPDIVLWRQRHDEMTVLKSFLSSTTNTRASFRPVQYPIHFPIRFYTNEWTGHATLQSTVLAHSIYGSNQTPLHLPSLAHLLLQQVMAPFFIFQLFCILLWCLDEYWYYAIYTLFALLILESTISYSRLQNLHRLHAISHRHATQRVHVRRGSGVANDRVWMHLPVSELLPGDWISLAVYQEPIHVPADIVLLHGSAVCDEALLTGESVPQLKQPLIQENPSDSKQEERFDINDSTYKESILFGGTVLLATTPDSADSNATTNQQFTSSVTPEPGITGIVLRTGFETAQGNLLRTMAHSASDADHVHTLDTLVFIVLLVVCAIGAALYVWHTGRKDERRNQFRLLLHVILIITSVVPPELPMELSLAITNSVADLMKRCQVYCTEHYRIPWAGQVTICCFDKTGTLTSDEMRLKGVRLFEAAAPSSDVATTIVDEDAALVHPADTDIPWSTARVMVACHSLALANLPRGGKTQKNMKSSINSVSSQVIGDPLELAVLREMGYHLVGNGIVAPSVVSEKNGEDSVSYPSHRKPVSILHRFAFSSKLKRMTVLCTEGDSSGTVWAVTKGAPETVKRLLAVNSVPSDFDEVAFHHMSRGRRVLAMAYREMGHMRGLQRLKDEGRDAVECKLRFAGFLVLDCPLKTDSKLIISELKKSGLGVVMITGDAILTAAEVARQVGIIRRSKAVKHTVYEIAKKKDVSSNDEKLSHDPLLYFECRPLGHRASSSNGATLTAALELSSNKLQHLIRLIHDNEAAFCITGDVLVSLATVALQLNQSFSTFTGEKTSSVQRDERAILMSAPAQSILQTLVPLISVFARHAPHQKEAVVAALNHGGQQTLMCGDGTNDVGALKRAHVGISIISAPVVEKKQREATATIFRMKADEKKDGKPANKPKVVSSRAAVIEESMRQFHQAQQDLNQVELGDASVAAPFTSRAVSIKCCKDVIQQGRCTLVTMLQIYKILGINCLVNAFVLSELFLHGVKQGDRQLTLLGFAVAALFFFVTRAEPLPTLSPLQPPSSVLCIEALISIAGQCIIHIAGILIGTECALSYVDPYDPSLVPDGPFNPNILNTCTFLLTCISTVNTFAVNYHGRPYMKDIHENKLFYRNIQLYYVILTICALEIFPPLNDLLQLTALPTTGHALETMARLESGWKSFLYFDVLIDVLTFPGFITLIMVIDTILSFSFERTIRRVYARKQVRK